MRFNVAKKLVVLGALGFLLLTPVAHAQNVTPGLGDAITAQNPDATSAQITNSVKNLGQISPVNTGDFGCDVTTLVSNCIAAMVYYIGPGLAQYPAYFGAYFFSQVVSFSLNSAAYALDFLSEGWQTVRDLANMAFIFILIYLAITIMLKADYSGTPRTLASVVVIALLVNFSFFFTRVAIDAGNILAVQFYNAIPASPGTSFANGTKDLSSTILNAVQFQTLFGSQTFEKAKAATNGTASALLVTTVIYLSVAAMLWMLFFVFMQVGIKFLLRIVGLWFVLIASPLAFVAKTMEKTEKFFDQWFHYLVNFSFYPAIFLFLFLIMNKAMVGLLSREGGGGLTDALFGATAAGAAENPYTTMAAVIGNVGIRLGFVMAMMYVALKAADWLITEGSGIAQKVTSKISGATLGTTKWVAGRAAGYGFSYGVGGLASVITRQTKQNPPKTRLGQYIDFTLRKKVLEPIAGTSLGGAGSYSSIESTRKERKTDWDTNKRAAERGQLVKDVGATIEANLKANRAANHGVSDQDKDRIQNLNKKELEEMKGDDVKKVVALFSEDQMKKIADMEKLTDKEKEEMRLEWQEHSTSSPLRRTVKKLEEIINSNPSTNVWGIMTSAKQNNTPINAAWMQTLKTALEYDYNHANAAFAANRTSANSAALRKANQNLKTHEKAEEELKKVPPIPRVNNNTSSTVSGNLLP